MTELSYERALREWVEARDMRYERVVYPRPEAGGDTVAYRLSPEGEPRALMLVVHGAGNDALFAFPGFFKQLLLRGFEIFTFDLDGHGRQSSTTFAYPAVTGALPAALEQARAGRTDLPVHTFGISLGGAVLLHALASPLTDVASAVLVTPPLRIHLSFRNILAELRPALLRTALRQREHCGVWGMVPSFGPVKRGVYPLRLAERRRGAFGYVDVLNEILTKLELPEAARQVRAPALLVYGSADRLVPAEQGILLDRLIPDSELLLVKGGTHLATFFADETIGRISQWLETHSPAEAHSGPQ